MQYWLYLFTGTRWDEFRKAGAMLTGFPNRMRQTVGKIQPGDVLPWYMTGVMRWLGGLDLVGPGDDKGDIWSVGDFPERVPVKPIIMLDVPDEVVKSVTEWSQNGELLLKTRRELAGLILAIRKMVPQPAYENVRDARQADQQRRQREMLRQRAAALTTGPAAEEPGHQE